VNEEVATALEREHQILPATAYVDDPLALEVGGHSLRRLGTGEPRIRDLNSLEPPAR
jgi:hypothetical protein